jgi:hypothetical protein
LSDSQGLPEPHFAQESAQPFVPADGSEIGALCSGQLSVAAAELKRYGLSVFKQVLRAESAFFVKKFVLRRVPKSASSSEFVEARWPVQVVPARQ